VTLYLIERDERGQYHSSHKDERNGIHSNPLYITSAEVVRWLPICCTVAIERA
jgi:hypothetical protein